MPHLNTEVGRQPVGTTPEMGAIGRRQPRAEKAGDGHERPPQCGVDGSRTDIESIDIRAARGGTAGAEDQHSQQQPAPVRAVHAASPLRVLARLPRGRFSLFQGGAGFRFTRWTAVFITPR